MLEASPHKSALSNSNYSVSDQHKFLNTLHRRRSHPGNHHHVTSATSSIHTGKNDSRPMSPTRRQRRRVDADDFSHVLSQQMRGGHAPKLSLSSLSSWSPLSEPRFGQRRSTSPLESVSSESEEEVADAVGQLSLNEDEQVRYHGKASGLHLLGDKDRVDSRNEGGIWYAVCMVTGDSLCLFLISHISRRFPKAGVWPPLPSNRATIARGGDGEFESRLPDPATQAHLLDLYFTHVHPSFPIVNKKAFFDAYRT